MNKLTEADWIEIYYALQSKIAGLERGTDDEEPTDEREPELDKAPKADYRQD